MGFSVVLNTRQELHPRVQLADIPHERRVDDPANIIYLCMGSKWDYLSSVCLRFADPYRQTIFNRLQMSAFLVEWQELSQRALLDEHKILLSRIEFLAYRCRDEKGFYLRFIGD